MKLFHLTSLILLVVILLLNFPTLCIKLSLSYLSLLYAGSHFICLVSLSIYLILFLSLHPELQNCREKNMEEVLSKVSDCLCLVEEISSILSGMTRLLLVGGKFITCQKGPLTFYLSITCCNNVATFFCIFSLILWSLAPDSQQIWRLTQEFPSWISTQCTSQFLNCSIIF